MAVLAAVDVDENEATVVVGRTGQRGAITILDVRRICFFRPDETPETPNLTAAPGDEGEQKATPDEDLLTDIDFRYAIATLRGGRVLFHHHRLPFTEQKKLEQVVPLQVQDLVPFEVDEFVIDSMIVGKNEKGEADVISSLIPQGDVKVALDQLLTVGIQPRVLTTKASAVAHLPLLSPEVLNGSFALLSADERQFSLAVFVEGSVKLLREFPRDHFPDFESEVSGMKGELIASLGNVQRDEERRIHRVFSVGAPRALLEILAEEGLSVAEMDLDKFVERAAGVEESAGTLAWAIGLFCGQENKRELFNYRRGQFAYRARWDKILGPLVEEGTYIRLFFITGILFFISLFYEGAQMVGKLDKAISGEVQRVFAGQAVPPEREVAFVQSKLDEIEEQLRAMGSLSSLSPLGALKEITDAIPSNLNVEVETMSIGSSRMTFSGTVSDIPSVGKLSTALERRTERFCDVKVDSKGKAGAGATSRVRFTADIAMCE